jgi:hypothetical protein
MALKVLIDCNSPLLQKSLEIFLKDSATKESDYDFLISDKVIECKKPLFLISNTLDSNIEKPFSKNRLQKELNLFYQVVNRKESGDLKLRRELESITQQFVDKLLSKIKEHYNA